MCSSDLIDTNLKILIEVLEKTRKKFPKLTFNFISSWFVYGEGPIPYSEEQPCNPKGFYSITKYAAEMLLKSYCATFDLDFRIIRLANVVGSNDSKASKKKNALQYLAHQIENDEPIELYENGLVIRDFIHVDDVVRGIDLIIEKGRKNEIFNLGSGMGTSLGSILREYHQSIGSKSIISGIPTPKFHSVIQVKDSILKIDKLQSLGFNPTIKITAETLRSL